MDDVTPAGSSPEPASTTMLPRAVLLLLGAAGMVVAAAGVRAASDVVAPVMLAIVLTVALMPVGRWARRRGWPSWAATLLSLATVYALVLSLVMALAVSLVQLVELLPTYSPRGKELTAELTDRLARLGVAEDPTSRSLAELDVGKLTNLLNRMLSSLLGALSSLFFLVTLLFFMTADAVAVAAGVSDLERNKPALARFAFATRRYFVMSAIFGGIVAVLDTGALWLLGVPLPLVWGLLSFVTNFIPNIGFVIGVIPPALLALLDQGWGSMFAVLVVYSALNVVIQSFIQPHFVGDAVSLSPTVTFLSLAVWVYLLGPVGALLAVPMTLLVRAVLVDPDPGAGWASMLIGSTPLEGAVAHVPSAARSRPAEHSDTSMAGDPV